VPRERFVPAAKRALAYADVPVEIAPGRFLLDPRTFGKLLQLAGLRATDRVLDVACGTGLMSLAATRLTQGRITLVGVDPSPGMSALARAKLPIEFHEGVAEALPVPDAAFDFVMMGYALRHVPDWTRAFREFARVLRPGGRVVLLEITRPTSHGGKMVFDGYFGGMLPVLGLLATGQLRAWRLYRYYWRTMAAAHPPAAVFAALNQAGFAAARHRLKYGCMSEYTAKKI
ncbi:MAG TPA: class I SAM-dependent methyltransferase, partial [Opitutales bacterium]|nr:class I SAM-dependent methyltransferase [Opitutales bacterium]